MMISAQFVETSIFITDSNRQQPTATWKQPYSIRQLPTAIDNNWQQHSNPDDNTKLFIVSEDE